MNEMPLMRDGLPAGALHPAHGFDAAQQRPLANRMVPLVTQYLNLVRRARWMMLGVIVSTLAVGLVLTLLMTPKYTAEATIEIQRENYNIVRVQGVAQESSPVDLEFYSTQYGLLKSESLATRVAQQLRLEDNEPFFAMYSPKLAKSWFEQGRARIDAPNRVERAHAAAGFLLSGIKITPQRLSRLVTISFASPDADFSVKVVNAWTQLYITTTLERRFDATAYARRFLENRLGQLRERLNDSERQLVAYAANQRIVNLPGGTDGAERSITADDLASTNRALAVAITDRIEAQSRYEASRGPLKEDLQNGTISGLRQRRAELAAEYQRLMAQFEPTYPPAIALQRQLANLDASLAREEGRVRQSLQGEYAAAGERESRLQSRLGLLKGDLTDVRRRNIQYTILQREADTNRQLYDALLQRYKEIGVAGGIGVNNISVVDEPLRPNGPSSPKLILNLLLALVASMAVALGLAIVREQVNDAIDDPNDVRTELDLPILGIIPTEGKVDPAEALTDRKSDLSEAYLAVQTSLAFATETGVPKVLAVTSSQPGEGKSTTALALARTLSRTGNRVLLMDGDMRSPSVHHLLGLDDAAGLSNFLAGEDDIQKLIQPVAGDGFLAMAAGPQPPNAAELLSGGRFAKLIDALGTSFDHVVIDAPPVMGLADAPLLASRVDGVVFVVQAHATRMSTMRVAVERLRATQARMLGAVLTRFDTRRSFQGFTYDYGYGYGYGQGDEAR